MIWGYLSALVATLCYGAAATLEARGAARVAAGGTGVRVAAQVIGQPVFVVGMLVDLTGFMLAFAALRELPLFAVQAAVAGSLAVTALLAHVWLGTRIVRRDWAAVGAVCAGLCMLGVSAAPKAPSSGAGGIRIALVLAMVAAAGIGLVLLRMPNVAIGLGAVAGFGFSLTSISARTIGSLAPGQLVRNPATYVIIAGGVCGIGFFAVALQRGTVAPVTAAMTVAQTVAPALVGVALLGDRPRHDMAVPALLGFAIALSGAIALARFGEPETHPLAYRHPEPETL